MFKYLINKVSNLDGRGLELARAHQQVFSTAYAAFKSDRHEDFVRHTEQWLCRFPTWQSTRNSQVEVMNSDVLSVEPRYVFFEGEYLLLYAVSKSILGDHAASIKARIISEMRIDYTDRSSWGSALVWRMMHLSVISDSLRHGIARTPDIKSIEQLNLSAALSHGPLYHGYPLASNCPEVSIEWNQDVLVATLGGKQELIDFSIGKGIRNCAMSIAEFICTADTKNLLTKRVLQTMSHRLRIVSMEKYTF